MKSITIRLWKTFKWVAKYPDAGIWMKMRIFIDYLNLYRHKGLTRNEYQDFEFEKQPEEFRQTFLGLNEQRLYLDYLNPIKYYSLARNKYLTHKILENTGVRKADLYCYYQPEGKVIESDEIANNLSDVCRILKAKHVTKCVVKTTESSHGDNVYVVNHLEFEDDDCKLTLFNHEVIKLSDIIGQNPIIFESVVKQTAQLASFNTSSVNTVRIMTTLYPDNKARLVATFIKIGRNGKCVDNAGGGGNVDAYVDEDCGELKYVIQYDGWGKIKNITCHPDNGNVLEGLKIDNWQEIVKQVLHFQECFPYCKAAGWDIAITDDGPVVIEVNDFWDRTGQYFIRRGWRNEIRDCYLAWKKTGKTYKMYRQPNILKEDHLKQIAKYG